MPTRVYIYGAPGIWPGRVSHSPPIDELERSLNSFLAGRGEVVWDDDEHTGPCWGVELDLDDKVEIDAWIKELAVFLRRWGVPDGPVYVSIFDDPSVPTGCRRIVI